MSSPSSIRHRDSYPQPLEYQSSPITTKPGLLILTSVTRKNRQMSLKVAQNDFTRNMIDYDTFTKIA